MQNHHILACLLDGNILGTRWEPIGNLMVTCWEQRKNEKNPPLTPPTQNFKKRKKEKGTLSACRAFQLAAWNFYFQNCSSPFLAWGNTPIITGGYLGVLTYLFIYLFKNINSSFNSGSGFENQTGFSLVLGKPDPTRKFGWLCTNYVIRIRCSFFVVYFRT